MEDLLNPVKATPTDTCDTIDFRKELFALTEAAAASRGMKSGKLVSVDKIRPQMLKALNGEVLCLTSVAWRENLKNHQTTGRQVIIFINKKDHRKKSTNYREISLLGLPGKVYAKALTGNAEK